MKIKVIIHEAEEGGFWAEYLAIPGCATEGETMEELTRNLREAIEGCLAVDVAEPKSGGREQIWKLPCEGRLREGLRAASGAARLALFRVSGSHHIYGRDGRIVRLSVPIHGNRSLKIGLLRHSAKLAEIPDSDMD